MPLVYSLLPNKKQATSEELFKIIEQHIERKPKYILKKELKTRLVLYFLNVMYLVVSFILNNVYEGTFIYVYLNLNKLDLFFL